MLRKLERNEEHGGEAEVTNEVKQNPQIATALLASQRRKGKTARNGKEERNARFIFAGFDTGANGVLNDVVGS